MAQHDTFRRMSRIAVIVSVVFVGAIALTGCTPGAPSADHSSGASASSPASTPSASTTAGPATPAFTLPADCTAIASAATLTTLFTDIPSRPPGDLTRPAPASASKKLTCSWFAGDTTGGDVVYYSAPAADGQSYLAVMQGK